MPGLLLPAGKMRRELRQPQTGGEWRRTRRERAGNAPAKTRTKGCQGTVTSVAELLACAPRNKSVDLLYCPSVVEVFCYSRRI